MPISLLEEFVWSLDKAERSKLKPLKFRGRKRQLFLSIINKRPSVKTAPIAKAKKKAASPVLHSMRSEILDYCYDEICPNGGVELLTFLVERGLYRHFAREVVMIERDIIENATNEEREGFYLNVFKLIKVIPLARLTNDVVWNKLRDYPQKYIDAKIAKEKDDHYFPVLFHLGLEMRQAIIEHRPEELLASIEVRLHKIEKEISGTKNILLYLFLNRRYIVFYKNIKIDVNKVAFYVEREAKYFEEHPNMNVYLFENMSGLYRAEVAYFRGEFDRALEYFKDEHLHNKQRPLRSWPVLYAQMFVLTCHIVEDYKLSRKILEEKFSYFLDFQHSPHAVLAAVLFARQTFFEEDFASARWYVELGNHFNTGMMFDPVHDLDLKILENALIMLSGNYEQAHDRAVANLRICSRRGYSLKTARMPHYFKAIEELSDAISLGEGVPAKTRDRMAKFSMSFVYPGRVLQKIISFAFKNEKV